MKIQANGIQLYYEHQGKGPPLVLIAGFTADTSAWNLIRSRLARHFSLYLFDNRGAGRSDSPDSHYTIDDMAQDAKAFIEAMHLQKPIVLGHSMGGAIAQTLAFKHPDLVKQLILANTFIHLRETTGLSFKYFLKMRSQGMPFSEMLEGSLPWLFSDSYLKNRNKVAAILEILAQYPYAQSLIGQKRQLEALLHFSSESWFHKISPPTLIIEGKKDITCPEDSERLSHGISGAQSVVFPDQGHMPHVEIPQEFTEAILDFLLSPL